MRLARLLTLRSLAARPLRMLLSGFGIVLGVAAILGIGAVNQAALESVTRLMQDASGKAALTVTVAELVCRGLPTTRTRRAYRRHRGWRRLFRWCACRLRCSKMPPREPSWI